MKLASSYSDLIQDYFSSYIVNNDESFITGAEKFVSDFSEKDVMEVWIIDDDGRPIVSSSGVDVTRRSDSLEDYKEALMSEDSDSAFWTGKNANDEKIMAYTVMLDKAHSNVAVRYMISLEYVDDQLGGMYFYGFLCVILVLAVIVVSGQYFIRSIISPIGKMRDATATFAKGDFTAEMGDFGSKELNELGESIGYMISEIKDTDRMKNDFISTISHELRTPLTAIKGWGETLLQIGASDTALMEKGMNVIIGESQRLSELVEELLDFSRISNGALKLRIEKVDILAELDEAVFVFRDRASREGIELVYNAPEDPAPALGDANRITQVFTNVLDNAIKYNTSGGKVTVLANIREDNHIVITVSDTGCGISEEDLPKVKEKFYKTNNTVRGSGIGLAVADEIIRLHGGDLEITSELGRGTTVKIILPIDESDFAKEKE